MEPDALAVFKVAKENNDRYLLPRSSYRRQDGDFPACEKLTGSGHAFWDLSSAYYPCIKLTGKPADE